jgi:alpha-amylase/alpha-mannosidase (GH57 family)
MTRVALLWHMHQPYYEDLVTREHLMPWVRFHALKDYYGMVALLAEFPGVRVTFNLVPSLLVQVEAFAANRARDRFLELSLRPADELSDGDIAFMLRNFFHANRQRMIDVYPRYAELLALRDGEVRGSSTARRAGNQFGIGDLRDLQVWHKLAWIDPLYMDGDSRVRALLERGRDFAEDDKHTLRDVELELLNAVIPAYRDASARGQVELSTSPFYHPILPLLCDTDVYDRTHPEAPRPRKRFTYPEDAREQLRRAVECHARMFGHRPRGVWPSEGSVSTAIVPLVAEAGFEWMASDELILARTLGSGLTRDRDGHLDEPERLYRPYAVEGHGARVSCLFRDHVLSDQIGFVYSGWPPERAADDFVDRLVAAGRRFSDRTGGGEAVIPVILDGENAWEHFPGGGRAFLRALYGRLSAHSDVKTVTMSEASAHPASVLPDIFPGSWIDGNFYIWIGHADDRTAWSQLAEARETLDRATGVDPAALARAREEILIAEGSDWFWWYGDDHSSDHDLEFDDLFRRHLRNAYRLLDRVPPDELLTSNISTGVPGVPVREPSTLIHPTLDGEVSSYFEWLGAGRYDVRDVAGVMHQIARTATLVTTVYFGFDQKTLYLRLDTRLPAVQLLEDGIRCVVQFLEPDGLRLRIRRVGPGRLGLDASGRSLAAEPRASVASVLEVAIPLADLASDRGRTGSEVRFFVGLENPAGLELERHPPHRPISTTIPDARFDSTHWRV